MLLGTSEMTFEEQATNIVEYYQGLADGENGARWRLGLFMAEHWLHLLRDSTWSVQSAKLFLQALESERINQGSGWTDLWLRVRNWMETVEP